MKGWLVLRGTRARLSDFSEKNAWEALEKARRYRAHEITNVVRVKIIDGKVTLDEGSNKTT